MIFCFTPLGVNQGSRDSTLEATRHRLEVTQRSTTKLKPKLKEKIYQAHKKFRY